MTDNLDWLLGDTAEPETSPEAGKAEKEGKGGEEEKQTVSEQFLNDVNEKSHDNDFWKSDEDENVFDNMKFPVVSQKHTQPSSSIRLPAPEKAPLPPLPFPFSTYIDDSDFSNAIVLLTSKDQLDFDLIESARLIISRHEEDEPDIHELVKNWWLTAKRITDIRKNQGGIKGRPINSYKCKLSRSATVIFCKALGYSETTTQKVLDEMTIKTSYRV